MSQDVLKDRVIVIIGGTSGLGLSAAKACVAAGAKVVAVGRDDPDIARAAAALGDATKVIAGDATDPAVAPAAIATAAREFGGFHGLYHVAGGSGRSRGDGPLHQMTDEGFLYTMQLNLATVAWSNRAAAQWFLENDARGSVVNVGSVLASSPSPRYFATHAYAAAKAAIEGMTRSAAAYYAPHDVRFNVIAPGLVETRMSSRAADDETIQRFVRTKQPLDGGRIGQPEDVDAAVVFLLSDASRFVTGQVLHVDGGWGVTEGQFV